MPFWKQFREPLQALEKEANRVLRFWQSSLANRVCCVIEYNSRS